MKKHLKLPHIDAINNYQFISFRTHDSTDAYVQKIINNASLKTNIKEYSIDTYLDTSLHGSYLHSQALEFFYNLLILEDKKIYDLVSFTIMPNHVHILLKQKIPLADTLRIIKSKSAIGINKIRNKSGKFWASDYYDKVIRDEQHFKKVYTYIQNNALKAGLENEGRFYSVYDS